MGTKYQHTYVRITPDNQELWAGTGPFTNIDADGNYFATISAEAGGPFGDRLVPRLNRPEDVDDPPDGGMVLKLPAGMCEDEAIRRLFDLYNRPGPFVGYSLPLMGGYNSNSFSGGLLNASGMGAPSLPPGVNAPLYGRPLPGIYFK